MAGWGAQAAQQPPAQPRTPLVVAGHEVGRWLQGFWMILACSACWISASSYLFRERNGAFAWHLPVPDAEVTPALNALAAALRQVGRCGPWRDEQLAVTNVQGAVVGTVERGAVRVWALPRARCTWWVWRRMGACGVQWRSLTGPITPANWDTLMGGMVSAQDSLQPGRWRVKPGEAGLGYAHAGGARWSPWVLAPAARVGAWAPCESALTGSVPRCPMGSALQPGWRGG